jgi:hypothetical protein
MAIAKKTAAKKVATKPKVAKKLKKTIPESIGHYTTFERTGIILFTLLAISFLFVILTKYYV